MLASFIWYNYFKNRIVSAFTFGYHTTKGSEFKSRTSQIFFGGGT